MMMYCTVCGCSLKAGDDAVKFLGNVYCSEDCLHCDVDEHAEWMIVDSDEEEE